MPQKGSGGRDGTRCGDDGRTDGVSVAGESSERAEGGQALGLGAHGLRAGVSVQRTSICDWIWNMNKNDGLVSFLTANMVERPRTAARNIFSSVELHVP